MSSFTMHRSLAAAALTMLLAACAGGSVQPITQTPTAPLTAVSGQAAGSISLSQTTYTVAQSAGTLTVTANRTGGSSGGDFGPPSVIAPTALIWPAVTGALARE